MRRKKYILQIENPCEEKWSEMTEDEAGRFCAHCSKTVIDFTILNDSQIFQLLEKSSEKMCRRLLNIQMNRLITDNTENNFYRFPRLVAGLLLAETAMNSIAQTNEVKAEITALPKLTSILLDEPLIEQPQIDSVRNSIQVKGVDGCREDDAVYYVNGNLNVSHRKSKVPKPKKKQK